MSLLKQRELAKKESRVLNRGQKILCKRGTLRYYHSWSENGDHQEHARCCRHVEKDCRFHLRPFCTERNEGIWIEL